MKTLEKINDAAVLKAACRVWGKDHAIEELNAQIQRFLDCLEAGTIYAVVVKQMPEYDSVKLIQVAPQNRYFYNFNALLMFAGFRVNNRCNAVFYGAQTNTTNDAKRRILSIFLRLDAITVSEYDKYNSIEIPRIFA